MKVSSLLLVVAVLGVIATQASSHSAAYLSMERKLDAMDSLAAGPQSRSLTTVLTDPEMNAWFAEGGVKWPRGVTNARIQSQPAVITGTATVDFDEVTAGKSSANPLMLLFSGVHDVKVIAQATAANGRGSVRVDSVYLDEVKIPRAALELFIDRFLRPRYPQAGLNSSFDMPNRIDTAIVGTRQITFVQK